VKIEIVKTYVERGGSYWWLRLRARNGRIVLVTETYRTSRAARRAAVLLTSAASAPVVYVDGDEPPKKSRS
jgi:uncharacterized protein YegP (UPF0339 family)